MQEQPLQPLLQGIQKWCPPRAWLSFHRRREVWHRHRLWFRKSTKKIVKSKYSYENYNLEKKLMKSKYLIWKPPLNHLVVHASQHIISERGSERFKEVVDFVRGGSSCCCHDWGRCGNRSPTRSVVTCGMFDQMTSWLESHSTNFALVRQTSLMALDMYFFVLFARKWFITDLTDKGFFSSMASVVCRQRVLLLERHWATIALVWVVFDVPGN